MSPIQISSPPTKLTVGGAFTVRSESAFAIQPVVELVNISVTEPDEIPITVPLFAMVAIPVLLLDQVPPEEGLKVVTLPIQIEEAPKNVGVGLGSIIISSVGTELHPDPSWKMNVAVPGDTPVTVPSFVTVATVLFVLDHVPPVFGESEEVFPTQMVVGPLTETVVGCTTVNTLLESETHPEFVLVKINCTLPGDLPVIIP